jgi:hypothetical protein
MFCRDWNTLDWMLIKLLRNCLGLYSLLLKATFLQTSAQSQTQYLTWLICFSLHTQKLTCEINKLCKSKLGMFFQWSNCIDEVLREYFGHSTLQTMRKSIETDVSVLFSSELITRCIKTFWFLSTTGQQTRHMFYKLVPTLFEGTWGSKATCSGTTNYAQGTWGYKATCSGTTNCTQDKATTKLANDVTFKCVTEWNENKANEARKPSSCVQPEVCLCNLRMHSYVCTHTLVTAMLKVNLIKTHRTRTRVIFKRFWITHLHTISNTTC